MFNKHVYTKYKKEEEETTRTKRLESIEVQKGNLITIIISITGQTVNNFGRKTQLSGCINSETQAFPVAMYCCDSRTVKKAGCRRTDAFELWSWRRLLRVSWTARTSNQSILKEISPEYSLEGLILKTKHQYFAT